MKRRDFLRVSSLSLATLMRAAEARDYEFLANELGIARVTDPGKRVTDTVVLRHLAKQGIDKDYVEFDDDYEKRPYSKGYRDIITGRRILVSSGLPMRRLDDGSKIIPRFERSGSKFYIGNNLFEGVVEGNRIALVANNDQPNGMRKGDELVWQSRLFIGGVERKPLTYTPTLLEADPVNANYSYNVLEWDYGVCKRRLRVIEGTLRSWWTFSEPPGGNISIVHNKEGKGELKLGVAHGASGASVVVLVDGDVEVVTVAAFSEIAFPLTIGDSATFYPDADPESSSVDGYTSRNQTNSGWWSIHDGVGTLANDSSTEMSVKIKAYYNTNTWWELNRGIAVFDTSALPDDATIEAATLSLYGAGKYNSLGGSPGLNIYSAGTLSNTSLSASDHDDFGSTPYSSAVAYASWSTSGYNAFSLNSTGLSAIDKTGTSKFGVRESSYDAPDTEPPWASAAYVQMVPYTSEQGTGYKPKLTVTYTPPPPSPDIARALMRSGGPVPLVSNGKANKLLYHGR